MPQSRDKDMQLMAKCLNSPDGKLLMQELETLWDRYTLLGETPIDTGHRVGLRDAFKHLQQIADYEGT